MTTPAQIEAAKARFQLGEGSNLLRRGRSRFGRLGLLARAAALRATKPLGVREALVDERLLGGLEALAIDTSIGHRGASSFPDSLNPGVVVDVATDVGPLFMHADDRVMTPFIRHHGVWEASEARFLRATLARGATLVDVGANVGYFSVLGSELVGPTGRVIAIEPEPRNVSLLKANLWRNGCDNTVILPIAAYRDRGFLPLSFNEDNRGDHQVARHGSVDLLVPCARLDDLLADIHVDFVKIDTQGVDHDVVEGLSGLIQSDRVPIMCEFWLDGLEERGVDPLEVAGSYERLGFELALLEEAGTTRRASAAEVHAAAAAEPERFVNVVLEPRVERLRRPSRSDAG